MVDTEKNINPSKGGRGKRSDYPTVTIRVPQILKESIQDTIIKFYQGEMDGSRNSSNLQNDAVQKLIEIQDLIIKFKLDNNVTKRQVKLHELITRLEVVLEELG